MRNKPKGKQISPWGTERNKGYTMNEFEMIEKLVEKTNVSSEEAQAALKACSGDIVDAVIYLERKAKEEAEAAQSAEAEAKAPEAMLEAEWTSQEDSRTNDDEEPAFDGFVNEEKGEATMKEAIINTKSNNGAKIRGFFRKVKEVLVNNELRITRNGEEKVRIPAWVAAILIACFFHIGTVILIVSLFFGCRYSFVGKDDLMSCANDVMDKAGDLVDKVKVQFTA